MKEPVDMEKNLSRLNDNLPGNTKVKTSSKKGGRIILSPSNPQDEPLNISSLKAELMKKMANGKPIGYIERD